MNGTDICAPFADELRRFVESTPWRFAKTYAATWPHEYVVRNAENATMVFALARHIFEHGIEGRFYSQIRRYHHQGGKVYLVHGWDARSGHPHQSLRRGADLRGATLSRHSSEALIATHRAYKQRFHRSGTSLTLVAHSKSACIHRQLCSNIHLAR